MRLWSREEIPYIIAEIEENLAGHCGATAPIRRMDPDRKELDEADTRTYSTVMALWVLLEAAESSVLPLRIRSSYVTQIKDGVAWLLQNYDENFGWVPNPSRERQTEVFIGLSSQIIYILGRAGNQSPEVEERPDSEAHKR